MERESLENKFKRLEDALKNYYKQNEPYIVVKRWADIQARYDRGTDVDRKIIDFFVEGKASLITDYNVKYDIEQIMWVLDEMVKQVKQPTKPTAMQVYSYPESQGMTQVYMKCLMLGLLIIKCHRDNVIDTKGVYFKQLKTKVRERSHCENYTPNLLGVIYNTDIVFKSDNEIDFVNISKLKEQVTQNTQDINKVKEKVEHANDIAHKTANVIVENFNANMAGVEALKEAISQQKDGFDKLSTEAQILLRNIAPTTGIVKEIDGLFVWLLGGAELSYFVKELQRLNLIEKQSDVADIMYHYHNGKLKNYSNLSALAGDKKYIESNDQIDNLLAPYRKH